MPGYYFKDSVKLITTPPNHLDGLRNLKANGKVCKLCCSIVCSIPKTVDIRTHALYDFLGSFFSVEVPQPLHLAHCTR